MNENQSTSFDLYVKAPSGTEAALHVELADVAHLQEIVDGMKRADALLKAAGFQRSERLDKPAYQKGGGNFQPRPETPPPADLEVPSHCGEHMRYVEAREASGDKKAVAAHWDCRKGRGCVEGREVNGNRFPFTNWHLNKRQAPKESTPPAPVPAAQGSAAPGPLGYGDFKTQATQRFGMFTAQIVKFAGVKDEAELRVLGPEQWLQLLDQMQATKAAAAA